MDRVLYPDKNAKRFQFSSQFFNPGELDSNFLRKILFAYDVGAFHHFYVFTMCYAYGHVFVLVWDCIECSKSFHINKWLSSLSYAVTKGDGRIPDIFVILGLGIHIIMSFRSLLYVNRTYNLLQHVSSNRQIILHTFF